MSIFNKVNNFSSKLTVLYVEDEENLRNETAKIFNCLFKNLIISSNGEDGLNKFKENKIDLVITDICMPKLDGLKMIENMKALNNQTPIVVLSAYSNPEYFLESINLGVDDYWIKPLNLNKVNNTLIKISEKSKLLKVNQQLKDYENALNNSSIVTKLDLNGDFTYVNEKFCEVSGYSKDELLKKPFNAIHVKKSIKLEKLLKKLNVPSASWEGKLKYKTKDESVFWTKTIINPVFDEFEQIKEYLLIHVDITEEVKVKKYIKNKLHKTKYNLKDAQKISSQYEMAINESNILSKTNLKGEITFVNEKFCDISGYTKDELIGKQHNIIRHEDVPSEVFADLWGKITSGQSWQGIVKNKKKDGSAYWVSTTIIPIKNKKNKIKEYIAIRHDLTEVFKLHKEIENTQRELVYKLGEVGETRSKETGNHVKRVAQYSKDLALLYGLSNDESSILFDASPMHDIGKIGIPDSILKKPSKLTFEEFETMKSHCEIGYKILKGSNRPVLKAAAIISMEHHEKYDGSGYPKGLKGDDIHIYGRITAIADVFDALGSDRCYKKAWDDERIIDLFKNEKGKHFDPVLVDLFLENIDIFTDTRNKFSD